MTPKINLKKLRELAEMVELNKFWIGETLNQPTPKPDAREQAAREYADDCQIISTRLPVYQAHLADSLAGEERKEAEILALLREHGHVTMRGYDSPDEWANWVDAKLKERSK